MAPAVRGWMPDPRTHTHKHCPAHARTQAQPHKHSQHTPTHTPAPSHQHTHTHTSPTPHPPAHPGPPPRWRSPSSRGTRGWWRRAAPAGRGGVDTGQGGGGVDTRGREHEWGCVWRRRRPLLATPTPRGGPPIACTCSVRSPLRRLPPTPPGPSGCLGKQGRGEAAPHLGLLGAWPRRRRLPRLEGFEEEGNVGAGALPALSRVGLAIVFYLQHYVGPAAGETHGRQAGGQRRGWRARGVAGRSGAKGKGRRSIGHRGCRRWADDTPAAAACGSDSERGAG